MAAFSNFVDPALFYDFLKSGFVISLVFFVRRFRRVLFPTGNLSWRVFDCHFVLTLNFSDGFGQYRFLVLFAHTGRFAASSRRIPFVILRLA